MEIKTDTKKGRAAVAALLAARHSAMLTAATVQVTAGSLFSLTERRTNLAIEYACNHPVYNQAERDKLIAEFRRLNQQIIAHLNLSSDEL